MLSSLTRKRLALAALALVVLAVLVVRARDQPFLLSAAPQDQPGPVLLVPGYGGSTSALEVLAGQLRAAGHTATVLALPGDGTGDLREAAATLQAAATAALAAGAPSVDVVGYSAGGVTVRYWARNLGGASQARRIVTLGSPHHGAKLAGLGAALGICPPACRQLRPGSELLDALNRGDETPDGPRWTSIWTDQDETVTPPSSARLDGATEVVLQQVCAGVAVSHSDLPRAPLPSAIVLDALGATPAAAYGPADCGRLSS